MCVLALGIVMNEYIAMYGDEKCIVMTNSYGTIEMKSLLLWSIVMVYCFIN